MFAHLLLKCNEMRMTTPTAWGWWHLMWIGIAVGLAIFFYIAKKKGLKIPPKLVFGLYGFGTFALELLKQFMWAVSEKDGIITWSYSWYSAPFQFCTAAMFVSIALFFVKNKTVRRYLYAFLMFYAIISMTLVMFAPGDIFTPNVWINIHTSYMHFGGVALCMYVIVNKPVDYHPKNVLRGGVVFAGFVATALFLDIVVEKSGINHGSTFNMFYISPYYDCTLPVLS